MAAEIREFMGIGLFLGHGCLAPSCEFSGGVCIIPVFNLFPIHHSRHVADWIHLTCMLLFATCLPCILKPLGYKEAVSMHAWKGPAL